MSDKTLESIDQKLSTIIKLLALNSIKDKSAIKQAVFLNECGLSSQEIGSILNKSAATIRVQIHQSKTKGVKKSDKKEK